MTTYRIENVGNYEKTRKMLDGIIAYRIGKGEDVPVGLLEKAAEEARRIDERRAYMTPTGLINAQAMLFNNLSKYFPKD